MQQGLANWLWLQMRALEMMGRVGWFLSCLWLDSALGDGDTPANTKVRAAQLRRVLERHGMVSCARHGLGDFHGAAAVSRKVAHGCMHTRQLASYLLSWELCK
jgi:hypothetical protein